MRAILEKKTEENNRGQAKVNRKSLTGTIPGTNRWDSKEGSREVRGLAS